MTHLSRPVFSPPPDTTDHYDPDYDFLHQDLSSLEQMPPLPVGGCLSPLPESHSESSSPSPCPGPGPPMAQPHFTPAYPSPQPSLQGSSTSPLYSRMTPALPPPALPEKKRRSGASSGISDGSYSGSSWRVSFERHPSQYDNLMEEDMPPVPPFPLFTPGVSPMIMCHAGDGFVSEFCASETADVPQSPPPLPEKKSRHSEYLTPRGGSEDIASITHTLISEFRNPGCSPKYTGLGPLVMSEIHMRASCCNGIIKP